MTKSTRRPEEKARGITINTATSNTKRPTATTPTWTAPATLTT